MKLKTLTYMAAGAAMMAMGACSTLYTTTETQHVVVTRTGKPVRVIVSTGELGAQRIEDVKDPARRAHLARLQESYAEKGIEMVVGAGIHMKRPLVDKVTIYDGRLQRYDADPSDVVTMDKKHLVVDTYAPWRISDPLAFALTVQSEHGAQARLDDIIYSRVREQTGRSKLIELVRTTTTPLARSLEESTDPEIAGEHKREVETIRYGRDTVLEKVATASNSDVQQYGLGLEIVDVRIKRSDLPPENVKSVYDRMIAERGRISKKYRSEGEQEAQRIRAETDRQAQEIESLARKTAQETMGDADATAIRVAAEKYGQDPDFFEFWRTMQAYPTAYGDNGKGGKTKVLLDAESDFNRYLLGSNGK